MNGLNGLSGSSEPALECVDRLHNSQKRVKRQSKSRERMVSYGFSLNEVYAQRIKVLANLIGCSESEVVRRAVDEFYLKYYPLYRDLR